MSRKSMAFVIGVVCGGIIAGTAFLGVGAASVAYSDASDRALSSTDTSSQAVKMPTGGHGPAIPPCGRFTQISCNDGSEPVCPPGQIPSRDKPCVLVPPCTDDGLHLVSVTVPSPPPADYRPGQHLSNITTTRCVPNSWQQTPRPNQKYVAIDKTNHVAMPPPAAIHGAVDLLDDFPEFNEGVDQLYIYVLTLDFHLIAKPSDNVKDLGCPTTVTGNAATNNRYMYNMYFPTILPHRPPGPAHPLWAYVRHPQLAGDYVGVWAAGTLQIRGNQLLWISNDSGHYKPSAQSIDYAIQALRWSAPFHVPANVPERRTQDGESMKDFCDRNDLNGLPIQ